MNILVTGGSGFIGRNIVKMLKEEGNTVGTYDIRDKNSVSDYHIMSDVRNLKMLEKACSGIDYVFHLAAVTSPPEFENLTGEGYIVFLAVFQDVGDAMYYLTHRYFSL